MKKIHLILIALFFINGLAYAQENPMLLFSGTITDLDPEDKLGISYGTNVRFPLEVENGKFEIRHLLPENGATVTIDIEGPKGFRYAYFYLGNETVELNASALNFNNDLKVEGSSLDSLRYASHMQRKSIKDGMTALKKEYDLQSQQTTNIDSLNNVFIERAAILEEKEAQIQVAFLMENINTPYGINSLTYSLPNLSKSQLENLITKIDQKYQDTPEVRFATLYAQYPKLEQNDRFYDFTVIDQNGEEVDFKNQFDGRYVVLDFSHPYCGYCRFDANSLKKLSTELGDKVNLFSVMNDKDKQALEEFKKLRTPGSKVHYVPTGKLDPAIAKYKVSVTPTYFVFSPKGELLLYQEGEDDGVQEFIENHIKNNPV